jgi:hypothetical protein
MRIWLRLASPILLASALSAQSVWLPAPGRFEITPAYTYQTFDTYQKGALSAKLPSPLTQQTGSVSAEVGISTHLAADATLGYSATSSSAFGPPKSDEGLTDSLVGIRWKFLGESAAHMFLPALTVRVGAIIQGTYQPNFPFSAGNGASGVDTSLLFGKVIGESGAGVYGDAGYRYFNHAVPADVFGSAGIYKNVRRASFSFGCRHMQSLTGEDLGDAGALFPRLKVITHTMEFGLGVRDRGGRYYQFFAAKSAGGRNTGNKTIVGMAMSFGFRPHAFHTP